MTAGLLLSGVSAQATIIYQFNFTDLQDYYGNDQEGFAITLTYPDYVTTTGMAALPGPLLPTTLGYPVAFAGTNNGGWWGFDNDANSTISDSGFTYAGDSFLFGPISPLPDGYLTAPGSYSGYISGNMHYVNGGLIAFDGTATLTIAETIPVTEPATLAMLIIGLAGLGLGRGR